MTSSYLLRPTKPEPAPAVAVDEMSYLLFSAPSLSEVTRWMECQRANRLWLIEHTDAGWSACSIDDAKSLPTSSVVVFAEVSDYRDRSRRRRV